MKRICILINSLDGGGAERVVSTLLNNFVKKYECHLILMENNISYELDKKINIISLDEKSSQSGIVKLFRMPIIAYKLSKIIKKHKFSQVISFLHRANYVNSLSKYISSHQVVLSERIASTSLYSDNSIISQVSRYLIKILYSKSDLIISVSKAIQNDLIHNFNIKVKQKVVYNPYDIEHIRTLSKENIHINIIKEKSIITVGSLQKRKNHALLINAFANVEDKDYKLYILGKGDEEDNLKFLVQSLNMEERVIFLRFDNNPYKYLSKCSVFVLSSNSEGFPNVLAEAMVCGCSVISTDCLSGPREILAPKSNVDFQLKREIELTEFGILTPTDNIEKLKEAINTMVSDCKLRKKYSYKSKERANDFAIDKIVKEYELVIR